MFANISGQSSSGNIGLPNNTFSGMQCKDSELYSTTNTHVYNNYENWIFIISTQFGYDIESLFFVDHPKVDVCECQKQEAEAYQCYLIIPEPVHTGLKPPVQQLLCTIDATLKTEWKTPT